MTHGHPAVATAYGRSLRPPARSGPQAVVREMNRTIATSQVDRERPRSTVRRISAILNSFGSKPSQSMTGVARSTQLPASTVHRLLSELVECSLLERGSDGRFRIAAGFHGPTDEGGRSSGTDLIIGRSLDDLVVATGRHARFGALRGRTGVSYLEPLADAPGRCVPAEPPFPAAHATAAGKALLAHSPPDVVAGLVEQGLRAYTVHTLNRPEQLQAALAAVRVRGLAVCHQEWQYGMSAVAVPVLGPHPYAVGALEVAIPKVRDMPQVVPALRFAARILGRRLAKAELALHAGSPALSHHESTPAVDAHVLVPADRSGGRKGV